MYIPVEFTDLIDVDLVSTTPTDGQVPVYDEASGLWIPGTVSGGGVSPLTTKGDVFTHDGSADSRLPAGADGQVLTADAAATNGIKWATPSGSGTAAPAASATGKLSRVKRTAGDLIINATGWNDVGIADVTVAASAGEWVSVGANFVVFAATNNINFDVCTVVSGSPVNYLGGSGSAGESGLGGWFAEQDININVSGEVPYQVQAGDLSSGQVTFRLRYRAANTASRTIGASSGRPAFFWARVLG